MSRRLVSLGALLLLATLALWVGAATGVLSPAADASWSHVTLKVGLGLLAAGLIFRMVSPMAHRMGRGHCSVCGHPVERGHTYCMDHMQEAVNTYRDQARDRMVRGGKSHG